MKINVFFALILIGSGVTLAQGTFQNLDFEDATLVGSGGFYSASAAFPGWTCLVGSTPTTVVYLDARPLASAEISLVNDNPSEGAAPLQGDYSASLFSTPS